MINYVLGFAFNQNKDEVVLIEKQKPVWQKAKLNGVGGKWEGGENIINTMVREFEEEAGVVIPENRWRRFAVMGTEDVWRCYCYATILTNEEPPLIHSRTEEKVVFRPVTIRTGIVGNLVWLIPLARDFFRDPDLREVEITYG